MPPDGFAWDPESPGSRFTLRPALALPVPESEWPELSTEEAWRTVIEREVGSWLLEQEADEAGRPVVVAGEIGRGASGMIAVVEWLVESVADGVVDVLVAAAVLEVYRQARHRGKGMGEAAEVTLPEPRRVLVSRGLAVLLASAAVRETFEEDGRLRFELAQEPSLLAGQPFQEWNYVGLEPWIVLLRNQETLTRYVTVVGPDGEILGTLRTPMGEWEILYWGLTGE